MRIILATDVDLEMLIVSCRRTKKKRKSESRDDDDDDDVDDDVEEDEGMATSSDVEMADRDPSEDEDDGVESGEEQLGRGARQKAKVCFRISILWEILVLIWE